MLTSFRELSYKLSIATG